MLSSMVVSRDWPEVSVLECILGGLQIHVDVEPRPEHVGPRLAKSKIDALILDCDLDGTPELLAGLREELLTVPLLIIGSPSRRQTLSSAGASFVFEKPISVEQAVHKLSAARNLILHGRLRYHRQPIDLPVAVSYGRGKRVDAELLNLSQGGVAIHTDEAIRLAGTVHVVFTLPGNKFKLSAEGEIVWRDESNAGIRFLNLSERRRRDLQLWLAKQYLTQ
jgi:DNA-binding response OmpR family regulator